MKLSKEKLISALHSLNPVELNNRDLQINCPECGHNEAGISIAEENHPYGCYRQKACGHKGNIYTLRNYGIKISSWDKVTKIDDFEKIELKVFGYTHKSVNLQTIKLPLSYKRIFDSEYLNGRNWIKRDYEYWEAGRVSFGSLKNYIIFPIFQGNEIKAYVARNTIKEHKQRYNNSVNEFASLIGGIDQLIGVDSVILCEGVFDIVNVTRLLGLYDSKEIKAICTFGAKISDNQIFLLRSKGIKRIILFYDADVINKIKSIAFTLSIYFKVEIALLPENIDAGDCNLDQLSDALINTHTPLSLNLNRL